MFAIFAVCSSPLQLLRISFRSCLRDGIDFSERSIESGVVAVVDVVVVVIRKRQTCYEINGEKNLSIQRRHILNILKSLS